MYHPDYEAKIKKTAKWIRLIQHTMVTVVNQQILPVQIILLFYITWLQYYNGRSFQLRPPKSTQREQERRRQCSFPGWWAYHPSVLFSWKAVYPSKYLEIALVAPCSNLGFGRGLALWKTKFLSAKKVAFQKTVLKSLTYWAYGNHRIGDLFTSVINWGIGRLDLWSSISTAQQGLLSDLNYLMRLDFDLYLQQTATLIWFSQIYSERNAENSCSD